MKKKMILGAVIALCASAAHADLTGELDDAKTASDQIVATARKSAAVKAMPAQAAQNGGDRISADEASALKGLAGQAYKASDGSDWILHKRDFLTVHTFIAYGDNHDDGSLSIIGYRLAKGSDLQGYSIEMPSGAIGKWETSGFGGGGLIGGRPGLRNFRPLTSEEMDDFHKELAVWLDDWAKSKHS